MSAAGLKKEIQSLAKALQADLPIAELEKLEWEFKSVVREIVERHSGDPSCIFTVAKAQKQMGLLRKYKSYGIKACTPLGYAIFLLNHDEGFSFQNHLTGKVELFHFLRVSDGGYAFISGKEDWERSYRKEKFQDWLGGKADLAYESFKIFVRAGDVVKIDKPGIVHTAIGCVLEEYATASTDMVQRLHDQNMGKSIPKMFSKVFVQKKLDALVFPDSSTFVFTGSVSRRKPVRFLRTPFGQMRILHKAKEFIASHIALNSKKCQKICSGPRFVSLYVTEGTGTISLKDSSGKFSEKFTLCLFKGDSILLVPETEWQITNTSRMPLRYSFLSVHSDLALK